MRLSTDDRPLNVDMAMRFLPNVSIAAISTSPYRTERTRAQTVDGNDDFVLTVSTRSGISVSQPGRELEFGAGEAGLWQSDKVMTAVASKDARLFNVSVPRNTVLSSVGDIDAALSFCVQNKLNMIVSGGTSTGKTVAARKILAHVPAEERIVTIEEAAELLPTQPNAVTLIANRDAEFQSADVLLTATLRMRPDRIILGEVRGKEAMTFLEAINTGHGGSMTTLHAETPQLAVQRLAIAALKTEIPMTYADMIQYIENSIDVIIQAGRHDGKRGITEFYLPGATEIGTSS